MCLVDAHPGLAVEPVSDSSRYFVLRLSDPSGNSSLSASLQTYPSVDANASYAPQCIYLSIIISPDLFNEVYFYYHNLYTQVDMRLLEWDLKIVVMLLTSMSHYRTTLSEFAAPPPPPPTILHTHTPSYTHNLTQT